MTLFQCERYPQLRVYSRDGKRVLAQFKDGLLETDDPEVCAFLSGREGIKRLDPEPIDVISPIPDEVPQSSLEPDRTEELTALLDEALERGVLMLRGRRVYFNGRKVGDSKVNAVHNMRIRPQLVKEIERELTRVRTAPETAIASDAL